MACSQIINKTDGDLIFFKSKILLFIHFDYSRYPLGKDIIDSVENITDLAEPGVDVHCLHGTNITTPAGFR